MTEDQIIEAIKDFACLCKEAGITEERTKKILRDFVDLIETDPCIIVIYNTITVNYPEREQKFLFYLWGRLSEK